MELGNSARRMPKLKPGFRYPVVLGGSTLEYMSVLSRILKEGYSFFVIPFVQDLPFG
jgi:hypothetical protein